MKNTQLKGVMVILIMTLLFSACSKAGTQTGGGKSITSADALKAYLDSQPANSVDKPIKVKMSVNEQMIGNVVSAINSAGKYVSLDLSGSPLTIIRKGAFEDCTSLAGIIIPNSVTIIDWDAFEYCTNLTSVTIPDSVTIIRDKAFSGCLSLTSVTFQGTILPIIPYERLDGLYFYAFMGDLEAKYLKGGIGTYTTTAPVSDNSIWAKQ